MLEAVRSALTPSVVESLFALAFGFAIAGTTASAYELVWRHFPSFRMLEVGPVPARFAAIPLLIFTAPFIIMRNTLRGRRFDHRPHRLRHGGDRDRRIVEPDVGDRRGHGADRAHQRLTF